MPQDLDILLHACEGFDWDEGNLTKNWVKHKVIWSEIEETFFNQPLLIASDDSHSQAEARYWALGKTTQGRRLFICFTLRANKIRVISSRDQSKRERSIYEQAA